MAASPVSVLSRSPTPLARLLTLTLDASGEATFVFDDRGVLVHANRAAAQLLERLGSAGETSRERLSALLGSSARTAALADGGLMSGAALFVPAASADDTLADRERRAIEETLTATGWRLSETARRLGISRTTLWRRLRVYGLSQRPSSTS